MTAGFPVRRTLQLPSAGVIVVFHSKRSSSRKLRKAPHERVALEIVDRFARRRLKEMAAPKAGGERICDPRGRIGDHGQGRQPASIPQERHGEPRRPDRTCPVDAVQQGGRSTKPLPDIPSHVVGVVGDLQILRASQKRLGELDRHQRVRPRRVDDEL